MAMPWFPCYPNDLLGSLRWQMMTPEERGAYWQLLCLCYQSANGKIVAPLNLLSRMSGINLEQHPLVLEAFQQDENGAWYNERAYSEWLKRNEVSEKRAEAGAKGGAKRWQKHKQTDGKTIANATTSTSTSTFREHKSEKDSLAHSQTNGASGFDEFWQAYPKKRSKAAALKAWKKLKPNQTLRQEIVEAVHQQAQSPDWQKEGGQFIPYPASWLNAGGWQDEGTVLPDREYVPGDLPF